MIALPPPGDEPVVVHTLGRAGPAGTIVCRLDHSTLVEVDALVPGCLASVASRARSDVTAPGEPWVSLLGSPVARLAVWTAVVLVSGAPAVVERVGAAVVAAPWRRVHHVGTVDLLVLGREDCDLPDRAMVGDPIVEVDEAGRTVRVTVRPGGASDRLWARVHRGREQLFTAALRADGAHLSADLLLPNGRDTLVVDTVDRLSAPAPIDGPALARSAVRIALQSMEATAQASAARAREEQRRWVEASTAWLEAAQAWDDLAQPGRCGVCAAIALHASRLAGSEASAARARRLRDRAIAIADPGWADQITEAAVARLIGRPPARPEVLNPLLEPRLRAVIGEHRPTGNGTAATPLDDGLDRLMGVAERFGTDASMRRTVALGLRGWALACDALGRDDLSTVAIRRSAALARGTDGTGHAPA